jgi:hypothetical protein
MAAAKQILLANKRLTEDQISSASSQQGIFIDQPLVGANNVGDIRLGSSGTYFGTPTTFSIQIDVRTNGDLGTGAFTFSDDGGTTNFGINKVWDEFEVITENI